MASGEWRVATDSLSEVLNFELSRVWTLFLQDSMYLLLISNFGSHSNYYEVSSILVY